MNKGELAARGKFWVYVYEYHRSDINTAQASAYIKDTESYNLNQLNFAWSQWRRENTRPPMPSDLIKILEPAANKDLIAREIAARIVGAVTKFGWPNGQNAKEFIGSDGWVVVNKMGGWSYICGAMGSTLDPNQFQAQAREIIKGQLEFGEQQITNAISGNSKPQIASTNKLVNKLVNIKSLNKTNT